ncbi:Pycsar system effector family protein [Streptomyces axinellae]|uniref:Pycsar effector protein domain-containing protein n=1 Tax=Streptomyces axinellae TaxID=552788 RepID=A0ABP6CVD1_9ACTN
MADRLLQDIRGEITRADSKASVLLGALSMTVGAVAGVLTGRGWAPSQLPATATLVWWTGACALAAALFALLMAVFPRYRHSGWAPGMPLTYFGDVHRAAARGLLDSALRDTEEAALDSLAQALTATSRIVRDKHRWIRVGLGSFWAGTLLLCLAMVAD